MCYCYFYYWSYYWYSCCCYSFYCYCICCCRFCCIAFLAIMNAIFKFSALIIATSGSEYSRVRACEGEYFKAKRFAYQPFRKSFLLNICIRIATAYTVYGNMQMLWKVVFRYAIYRTVNLSWRFGLLYFRLSGFLSVKLYY